MMDGVASHSSQLRGRTLRRAMSLANINAGLWATGNGLVSTTLVFYFGSGTWGRGIGGEFRAGARFAGVLRLVRTRSYARLKRANCSASCRTRRGSLILCTVPVAAAVEDHASAGVAIAVLVAAWCLYHLAEFAARSRGLVTTMPARIRGRLIGRREAWLTGGRILGLATSIALASLWKVLLPKAGRWQPLALSASIGAVLMLIAVVPLIFMADPPRSASAMPRTPWRALWRALIDPAYRRILIFNFWFSVANGITATRARAVPRAGARYFVRNPAAAAGGLRAGQRMRRGWVDSSMPGGIGR